MGLIGLSASLTSQVAYSNSTTPKTILSLAIPANGLEVGSIFDFEASGTIATAATQHLVFGIAVNGTTIATISPGVNTSSATQGWYVKGRLVVRSLGSTGTVIAMLRGRLGTDPSSAYAVSAVTSPTTVDTTSGITLSCGMTWTAAATTNVATCDIASVDQTM